MEEIIGFVRDHLELEQLARLAALTELDEPRALAAIRRADAAYSRGARAGNERPEERGDHERRRGPRQMLSDGRQFPPLPRGPDTWRIASG